MKVLIGEKSKEGKNYIPEPEEFLGHFVDIAEDWLEEKGITPERIPNEVRKADDSTIIVGADYDYFADRFAAILGIKRDSTRNQSNAAILQAAGITEDMEQADRCELWAALVDTIEDWLAEKGITPDDIPNDEREGEDAAIIYGDDYDDLADQFAELIGINRDTLN